MRNNSGGKTTMRSRIARFTRSTRAAHTTRVPAKPRTGYKERRHRRFVRIDWKTGGLKPVLRGWIHTVATPLSLAASIVLLVLCDENTRWACAIYLASSLILFSVSALYHMGAWSKRVDAIFKRFDHANIFLLIAGTYTPISVALLEPSDSTMLLAIVWIGAFLGIAGHMAWLHAPRWVYTPLYVVLGWVAVLYMPQMWDSGGPAIVWLLIAGGLAYTLGALVYALKWPNPAPKVFGFHEIFHATTVAGWTCHCVAAYLAVLGA